MCLSVWHATEDLQTGKWVLQNNKSTQVHGQLLPRHIDWMDVKYGKDIQPIQFTLTMQQQEASSVGMFKDANE